MSDSHDVSRRDVMKTAAAAAALAATVQGAPNVNPARTAGDQVAYGVIGTGGRGGYLLKHLRKVTNGRCVAVCDLADAKLNQAAETIGSNPTKYSDYRQLLADKNVEATIIAVPLFEHYRVTYDSLQAGKHTFCEKSLVFKPYEVHALRALAAQHPKQVLQVGLQRRYSKFYQIAKQMVDKGLLGDVTHVQAQWHRNPGWVMRGFNWRLYQEYSGGLAAELASHQVDVADWMFGSRPDFVMGLGGLDTWKDGRDVFDNIQLIYKYPKNQKLIYTSISTNAHLPYLASSRPEFGECIMGTGGSLEITIGDGEVTMPTALFYKETAKVSTPNDPHFQEKPTAAGATFALGAGQRGLPLAVATGGLDVSANDSFINREMKFARRWLYSKGVMVDDEDCNPVETELTSYFDDCKTGGRPKADLEVGLNDSIGVILSNLCMREERKVMFSEIENMGRDMSEAEYWQQLAKTEESYRRSVAAKKKVNVV
ncbi:MAG TPA: Gfo/Idh/MocA family oxidoreductase [Bryobacteraceae bacterium]|nr:Gfo/Idh/MocA family oxidoreductase [Bryobacteraceae bacterium]